MDALRKLQKRLLYRGSITEKTTEKLGPFLRFLSFTSSDHEGREEFAGMSLFLLVGAEIHITDYCEA
jgi:hypothetical protein